MRSVYICTWLLLIGIGIPKDLVSGICELPDAWSGSWYENGVRQQVDITGLEISHKGSCVKYRHRTQYIFKDRSEGCLRCLSIHSKHKNILQYKESKCIPHSAARNHKRLCHSISVDEPLKTMFRVRAETQECPIKGHYTFSYSRGYGQCLYPLSSMSHCGNATSLIFRFQACPDIKGTESAVRLATCTASWREGSTDYFVARLTSSQSVSRDLETNFRCFVYKSVYTGYQLAMSAPGECNLYSATEGQTTFNLKRVREPERGCKYPEWARSHSEYMSLHGSTHLHFDHQNSILTLREADPASKSNSESLKTGETYYRNLQCAKMVNVSSNITRMVTLSTEQCWSGFQCVELERVSDDVMVLRVGRITFSPEDACNENLYFSNTKPVLITGADIKRKPCPLSGQYRITSPAASAESLLTTSGPSAADVSAAPELSSAVGEVLSAAESVDPLGGSSRSGQMADDKCPSMLSSCGNSNTMSFSSQCNGGAKEYTCFDTWQTSEGKMFILSPANHSLNRFCILMRENGGEGIKLEMLAQCTTKSTNNAPLQLRATHYGDCSPTALATANPGNEVKSSQISLLVCILAVKYLY